MQFFKFVCGLSDLYPDSILTPMNFCLYGVSGGLSTTEDFIDCRCLFKASFNYQILLMNPISIKGFISYTSGSISIGVCKLCLVEYNSLFQKTKPKKKNCVIILRLNGKVNSMKLGD